VDLTTNDQVDEPAFDEDVPSGGERLGRIRAGYIRSTLLMRFMPALLGSWMPVDVDEPRPIVGIWSWNNRRLSNRLWNELTRVCVTKQDGADAIVEVAGEIRLGGTTQWWPTFLIGLRDWSSARRVLVLSGTRQHVGKNWSGSPRRAFELLASISSGAGADTFWQVVSADEGYAQQDSDGTQVDSQ
jgi:hypothetical protein